MNNKIHFLQVLLRYEGKKLFAAQAATVCELRVNAMMSKASTALLFL